MRVLTEHETRQGSGGGRAGDGDGDLSGADRRRETALCQDTPAWRSGAALARAGRAEEHHVRGPGVRDASGHRSAPVRAHRSLITFRS
jgi:hypothetical protein